MLFRSCHPNLYPPHPKDEPAAHLWLATALATVLSIVLSLDKSTQVATGTFTPPPRKTCALIQESSFSRGKERLGGESVRRDVRATNLRRTSDCQRHLQPAARCYSPCIRPIRLCDRNPKHAPPKIETRNPKWRSLLDRLVYPGSKSTSLSPEP